jgi:hypothetical protein
MDSGTFNLISGDKLTVDADYVDSLTSPFVVGIQHQLCIATVHSMFVSITLPPSNIGLVWYLYW